MMWQYARTKAKQLWFGVRADAMITIAAFVAAYVASRADWFQLTSRYPIDENLAIGIYFVVFVGLIIFMVFAYHILISAIFGACGLSVELELRTSPGRKKYGRYLGIYIFNKSLGEMVSCWIKLKDVRAISGNWEPSADAIKREDAFLWGSAMVQYLSIERLGKKTVKRGNIDDTIVDLLHTGDNKKGGKVYFTQQYNGEVIQTPKGVYVFDIEIRGTHLGRDFNIPLSINFRFDGGMCLSEIAPITNKEDRRIKRLTLLHDNELTHFD